MTFRAVLIQLVSGLLMPAAAGMAAKPAPVDLYVLAGQSNMSGRGDPAGLSAAEKIPDPRIRLYGNDGRWHAALDPLDDATGQVDAVSADPQAAVGPGLFFARAMLRRGRSAIALVPCAKGGSSIGRWQPGGDRATLYGSCVARTAAAGERPAGMLWYQGESDALQTTTAVGWTASFRRMVDGFRRDVDAPRLPIVVVQLADQPREGDARYPGWASIREQQARPLGPCIAMVSAGGLPRNPDDLHLSTGAQRLLGVRLADAMAALRKAGCR
jgi:hypothetical protein